MAFVIVGCFVNFLVLSALAMLISYMQELGASLYSTNEENCKLLNAMHEGLIILQKPPQTVDAEKESPKVMFINNPVKKLVKLFASKGL